MPLQRFLQEFQRRLPISGLRHEALEHFAFVIDGPPEIVPLAVDLHEHLVQVPAPTARTHPRNPTLSDLRRKHRTEPVPPKSHRLMANLDATFVQQVLDIAKGKREPNVHHHRQADNFGARLEVFEGAGLGYPVRLGDRPAPPQEFFL